MGRTKGPKLTKEDLSELQIELTDEQRGELFNELKWIFKRYDYNVERALMIATYTCKMKKAIICEEYELAAEYRDRIKDIEDLELTELTDSIL